MDVLFAMQERLNTTLLLITHEPELTSRCTRVLHLADGRIAGDERREPARAVVS